VLVAISAPANELRSCLARRWLLLMQGTISLLGGWTEGNLKFLITFSSLLLHHIASEREMRKEKSMIECRGREMRNHQLLRATQWSAGVITSRALFALSSIYIAQRPSEQRSFRCDKKVNDGRRIWICVSTTFRLVKLRFAFRFAFLLSEDAGWSSV
jgi:hypothetical protein